MSDVTQILQQIESGDPAAAGHLLPLVYQALRTLATRRLAQENRARVLDSAELVHEAYSRLIGTEPQTHWESGLATPRRPPAPHRASLLIVASRLLEPYLERRYECADLIRAGRHLEIPATVRYFVQRGPTCDGTPLI